MGSSWKNIPLGNLIALQRGHDLPSQDREDGDIPIMGSSGLTGYHSQAKCEGPGVVVGRSGNSMGVVSFCEVDYWPLNTALYITDFKDNDPRYIYYLLSLIDFDKFNSGSAQKSLNRNAVYPYEVWATDNKDEQKSIGRLLEAYEQKIALNRQINTTLESMAQALFKSWFVDFDPVIDNALAVGNDIPEPLMKRAEARAARRSSAQANNAGSANSAAPAAQGDNEMFPDTPVPAEIQQLFPDRFVLTEEMGWVPEGWEVKTVGDVVDRFSVGKKFSQKTVFDSGEVPVLDQGKSGIIGFHNEKPGVLASPNDPIIVFANHTCYMRLVMHDFSAIQNVLPFKGKSVNVYWLFYGTLGKQQFNEYKGHWPDFVIHNLVLPKNHLDHVFGEYVSGMCKGIYERDIQNESLADLRDSLLPKLLSGQITIPDAEQQLAEVL